MVDETVGGKPSIEAVRVADQMESCARSTVDHLVAVARIRIDSRTRLFLDLLQTFQNPEYERDYLAGLIASAVLALADKSHSPQGGTTP